VPPTAFAANQPALRPSLGGHQQPRVLQFPWHVEDELGGIEVTRLERRKQDRTGDVRGFVCGSLCVEQLHNTRVGGKGRGFGTSGRNCLFVKTRAQGDDVERAACDLLTLVGGKHLGLARIEPGLRQMAVDFTEVLLVAEGQISAVAAYRERQQQQEIERVRRRQRESQAPKRVRESSYCC
jgi:hypothetical protein